MSFFETDSSGVTEEINFGVNEAELRRTAEQIARVLRVAMASAFKGIEREIGQILGQSLQGSAARNVTRGLNNIGQAGENAQKEIQELGEDLRALAQRSQAFQTSLGGLGQNSDLFAVFNTQVRRLLELEKEFQQKRVLLASDPERLEALRAESRNVIRLLQAEQVSVGRIVDAGRSHNVASQQQETTLRNAEIRTQGALAVATEQRTARARIEAFRFATRQILFLERQIVAAFRGTLNLAGTLGRGIAAGLGRVASIFRRGDASLNEGLQGALSQRERALRDSFQRQEQATRRTVVEQSRLIQQLEDRQRKGFAGLLSGRSQLGAALGVGGILGGGLLGANFIQGGLERFTSLERINIQLDRLTGSATATRDILADLVELAKQTPLELQDVSQTAVGLLAAGTGLKEVVPFVQALADAIGFTGGGAEQLQRVALAIRQIASKGRLQGEELRQLAESLPGLNITQLLADQITEGDTGLLLKMSEAGEVSATQFTQAFARALRSDQRIVGASTATVNTLGGQISILSETFDTLGAAVIGALEPFLLFSIKGTTDRLEFLTNLITNDTSPALELLRKGLIGVAIGLASIAALRAAGEVLQFTAIGLRAVLTPLGLLVTAFAAIGGAVAVLRVINPVFREMTDRLAALATGKITTGLSRLADLLISLGNAVVNNIGPGLAAFAGIVQSVIAPVLGGIAGLLVNVALPALIGLGNAAADLVAPALDILGNALVEVVQFLAPAIRGFVSLAEAIRDAFGGDFRGLLNIGPRIVDSLRDLSAASIVAATGLGALGGVVGGPLGAAIGVALGLGFGDALFNVIRPQLERVRDLVRDLLGGIDLTSLVVSISNAARRIGFVVGNIASDPRLINALERIALAGVLIGTRFIQGLAEGIFSNLPALVDMFASQFTDLLQSGIRAALNNPRIIIAALGALLFGDIVINFLRNIGKNWGKITGQGMVSGFQASGRNFAGAVRGFFTSAEVIQKQTAERLRTNTLRTFEKLARDIQAVGGTTPRGLVATDPGAINQMKRAFTEATKGMDVATQRGLIARSQFSQLFAGIEQGARTAGAAIGRVFGRRGTTWDDIALGARNAKANVVTAFRDMSDDLRARGTTLGQTVGAGILGGIAAAFSASQGGTIGVVGALSAVLVSGLSAGPIAAAVAAVGASIGLLINHFRDSGEAARVAAEHIAGYLSILKDVNSVAQATPDIAAQLTDTLLAQGEAVRGVLAQAGFDAPAFVGLVAAGQASLAGSIRSLTDGLAVDERRVNDFIASEQRLGSTAQEAIDELNKAARGRTATTQATALAAELRNADVDAVAFVETLQTLVNEIGFVQDAAGQADLRQQLLGTNSAIEATVVNLNDLDRARKQFNQSEPLTLLDQAQLRRSTQSAFDSVTDLFDGFKVSAEDFFAAVQEFARENSIQIDLSWLQELINGFDLSSVSADSATEANRRFYEGLAALNLQEEELAAGRAQREKDRKKAIADLLSDNELVSKAIDQLNKQRTEGIQNQISGIQNRLEAARDAATEAKEALTSFITAQFVDSPQALVDDLIGSIDGVGSAIEAALLQGGVQGQAAVRSALGGLDSQIAKIVQAGVAAGMGGQEIVNLIRQVTGAVDEQILGSGARISTLDFTEGITPQAGRLIIEELNRVLDPYQIDARAQALFNAESEVERIQRMLDDFQAELQVDVKFSTDQIVQALVDAGAPLSVAQNLVTPGAVSAAQQGSDLVGVIDTFMASLGTIFGNSPGQPLTPDQITLVSTTILGVSDPDATASAAVGAMSAAAGGTTVRQPIQRTTFTPIPGSTFNQLGTLRG